MTGRGTRLQVILLPTARCNAACSYCFSRNRAKTLSTEQMETVFQRLVGYACGAGLETLNVYWQGGEVLLLGRDYVKKTTARLAALCLESGLDCRQYLQSNLLGLTTEWLDLLRETFDGRVSSSWDYPNVHRKDLSGDAASYERIFMQKYRMLREAGFSGGLICIPGTEAVSLPPSDLCEHFFGQLKVRGFQINLPFPSRAWEAESRGIQVPDADRLADYLCALYEHWNDNYRESGLDLQPFSNLQRFFSGQENARLPCVWGRQCAQDFLSVGPDGTVGLCDCWVLSYPDMCYGNILEQPLEEIMSGPVRSRFRARLSGILQTECGRCEFLGCCFGGCPIRALTFTGALEKPDGYCGVYRSLFKRVRDSIQGKSMAE